MKRFLLILLTLTITKSYSQESKLSYENAFQELKGMISDSIPISFKRAVFTTENAYLDSKLSYSDFDANIKMLATMCWNISKQNPILYSESDKEEVNKYAAVFRLMSDSVKFNLDSSHYVLSEPYVYDFDDFWGEEKWEKMFVTKLLTSHSGNCHSLPFLYKILCEELGAKAYLAMAPNHTYVKQWCKKTGWYNTELTSRYFPIDAWIMASGYIHLTAVQNRIYMDTLSQKQSLSVCLIDLAKGYERKFPDDLNFLEKCSNLASKYYPNYTNAMILSAEITKKRFERIMASSGAKYPAQIMNKPQAKELFGSMEKQYAAIHAIGFRMMPKDMYLNWLSEIKREKNKYLNKSAISNFTQTENK